eukprot:GHRQ01016079.1.p1 GENE.GHRQ01016079.1~~GHRQ01016079.1.p1  ORF type:complete len:321 (+),score=104.82 GHRQ01016079.1:337-1299(+)
MPKGSKHARQKFRKWVSSYADVSAWLAKYGDLAQQLDDNGGLVKIENFLPVFVAEGILEMLQGINDETWNLTAAGDEYVHNNIQHEFLSVKQGPPGLQEVFRVFTLLLPDSLFTFSAAKYCKAGHIVPHDDRAYTQVMMDDGSMQLCSRSIACIYYLTKGWSDADGGHLADLEAPGGPQQHLPAFNSMVAFRIPRWHEVRPVTGDKPRYSIFGWFLEAGRLYELNTGGQAPQQPAAHEEAEQEEQQQQQQQHALPAVKRKRNRVFLKKRRVQDAPQAPGHRSERQLPNVKQKRGRLSQLMSPSGTGAAQLAPASKKKKKT